ncbi:MAG: hypothetical protein U0J89_09460, partial [Collinsella sp.]|nr:hypothetical protein [Collinsella sp.]
LALRDAKMAVAVHGASNDACLRKHHHRSRLGGYLVISCCTRSADSPFKYDRYYPDHQVRKIFNDLLGFRSMVDSYDDILGAGEACLKVVDMSCGKSVDDGYRGVQVYFTRKPGYYPVEIQYNTYYDRQINNWLHKHVYKRFDNPDIGFELRLAYERGYIHSEDDFVRRLDDVLSGC